MKIAIMQPYLFPYIGYFQLVNAVDKFVIHDDVQYIKGGWINRNRILLNGKAHLFTLSLKKDSAFLNINQRYFPEDVESEKTKLLRIMDSAYRKAPFYLQVSEFLRYVLSGKEKNISKMITYSIRLICSYLDIKTAFYLSSELRKDNTLKGEQRVININKCLGANHYINPIGGNELYSKEVFKDSRIELSFLQARLVEYKQFDNQFVPSLSIIDVLMFNSKEQVTKLLKEYDLL